MPKAALKHFAMPLILAAFTTANADIDIHEGMWEITNRIEMGGISIKIPETTISQCIDKQKIIPKSDKKINKYCKVSEQKIDGNTVTWKMQCTNNIESEGTATYQGDTFKGLIKSKTEVPNMGTMTMVIHLRGKRTGECKKD